MPRPIPPRKVIENDRQAWEALGIFERPEDQDIMLEIILRVYAPIHNNYVFDGYTPENFLSTKKSEMLLMFHHEIPNVPVAVRDHVPYEHELCLRLYDIVLYGRATDPGWLHIIPE
ncbi:uncharacterized protein N7479_006362 [Penicillium vulpinum]|uniref:Uncharacterized protein n=1 Tax=Penicillium vulpinum TaxID=29845 RepID=A0A1V6RGL9_9EURO|nr:uncharacterized protein N7479_006362 [Penicillium vulpinum]KAJ5959212.1 hypothetical protein N7479_006362 [Penicillium vulpinum]OQE00648.1 hypothetical protein PENVUL_c048G04409 [Penicillium vulpinum]